MEDIKKPVGRPPKWTNKEELIPLIESYFEDCKQRNEPPFITELAVWLDTNRETLLDYESKEEFSDTIKVAKARCEMAVEKGMMTNKMNATASIFNLKNNYKWKDKTEQDMNLTGNPIIQISQEIADKNALTQDTNRSS